MSCSCPECNNDWGGSCLYETIEDLRQQVERLKRERDEARADCEVKASYARIYAANLEQAEAALEVAREAFAFMYQYAGATDAPVQVLDNLVALAEGEPLVHPWNFPARSENDAYERAILLERDIHDRDCIIAALREREQIALNLINALTDEVCDYKQAAHLRLRRIEALERERDGEAKNANQD